MDKTGRQKKADDVAERQKALDNISEQDLEKIKAYQASTEGAYKVDEEWLLLAEFAITFGWQAYLDVKHDNIDNVTGAEMLTLIEASRKLRAVEMFENSQTSFIGSLAAKTNNPFNYLKKMTKNLAKRMKADEL